MSKTSGKKRTLLQKAEFRVPGFAAGLVCVMSVGLSGYFAIRFSDMDEGKTVTPAEMYQRMRLERVRIANDPHMPPQAKAMALGFLDRSVGISQKMAQHR